MYLFLYYDLLFLVLLMISTLEICMTRSLCLFFLVIFLEEFVLLGSPPFGQQ